MTSHKSIAVTVVLLCTVCGCAGRPRRPPERVAVVAIEPPASRDALERETEPARLPTTPGCSAFLTVLSVEKGDTCHLESAIVAGARGELLFPCDRQGDARAVFGDDSFEGSIQSGELQLHFERRFEYDDSCTWLTQQGIHGFLDDQELWFDYHEETADQAGCFAPCAATAIIGVEARDDGE